MSPAKESIFGVVLAGGKGRRFGGAKALAPLAGAPMASWSIRALQTAGLPIGVISDEEGVQAALGVPVRPDLEAGLGPIGGLWTALQWAQERGDDGVLLLGCDMPLVGEALIGTVLGWSHAAPAVVPMSPAGPEPLCALYRTACLSEVEQRVHSDDRSLQGLVQAIATAFIGEDILAEVVDLNTAFLNVNTVEERGRAEHLLGSDHRRQATSD